MKRIAIITGAGSGFGKEFVKLLAGEPDVDEIWAVARKLPPLEALAEEFGAKIKTVSLDLSDRASYPVLSGLLEEEEKANGGVHAGGGVNVRYLINNAGYGKFGSWEEQDIAQSLNMIDLNVGAVVALGLLVLPYMQRGSRIINISSQSSFFPLPYLNIYASTKVFVNHYTRALNVELRERGITATAVCPGWMKTSFMDKADTGARKNVTNFFGAHSPDVVAAKALRDAKRGRDFSTYSFYVKATRVLSRLMPAKWAMRMWLRQQGIK